MALDHWPGKYLPMHLTLSTVYSNSITIEIISVFPMFYGITFRMRNVREGGAIEINISSAKLSGFLRCAQGKTIV